jgi:hypothetical protein
LEEEIFQPVVQISRKVKFLKMNLFDKSGNVPPNLFRWPVSKSIHACFVSINNLISTLNDQIEFGISAKRENFGGRFHQKTNVLPILAPCFLNQTEPIP